MKKKILFLTNATGIGGSEKVLNTILKKLDSRKYDISIFSVSDDCEEEFKINGIQCCKRSRRYKYAVAGLKEGLSYAIRYRDVKYLYPVMRYWLISHIHNNKQFLIDWWESYKNYLSKFNERYDIVVAFGAGMVVPLALEKIDAKMKVAWVNLDLFNLFLENTEKTKQSYQLWYSQYDKIVTVTEGNYQSFFKAMDFDKSKVRIIPDILDVDYIYEQSKAKNPFKDEKNPVILTVGRISPEKGYDLLIGAAEILVKKKKNFKWYIIGNGEKEKYQDMIDQKCLGENVIFLGSRSNPYPYFKECDIYVQTSLHEGNCLTLLEAMTLGKACVTTNFPTGIEKIEHGVNGLVADMNALSIAEAVEVLLNNENNIREQYGDESKVRIEKYSTNTEKIDELFAELDKIRGV